MRSQELVGHKTVPEFKVDPTTKLLKMVEQAQHGVASYKTDLLLKSTLQRRGLALDMAGVMSYEVHDRLITFLFDEYMRIPHEGYAKTTVDQLHNADREIWSRLAKLFRWVSVRNKQRFHAVQCDSAIAPPSGGSFAPTRLPQFVFFRNSSA